jgi:putative membrane protein
MVQRDSRLQPFIQRWLITTVAVLVAANVVRGIHYDSMVGLLVASLLLGILNAFVRPVMLLISLPLLLFSLGLFVLFINAFLLYIVGQVVRSFHVDGFWSAFWGSLVISVVALAVNALAGIRRGTIHVRRSRLRQNPPVDRGPGDGPVIDV